MSEKYTWDFNLIDNRRACDLAQRASETAGVVGLIPSAWYFDFTVINLNNAIRARLKDSPIIVPLESAFGQVCARTHAPTHTCRLKEAERNNSRIRLRAVVTAYILQNARRIV